MTRESFLKGMSLLIGGSVVTATALIPPESNRQETTYDPGTDSNSRFIAPECYFETNKCATILGMSRAEQEQLIYNSIAASGSIIILTGIYYLFRRRRG